MNTKSFLLSFAILVAATICSFSQYTPKGMSYQAVARDEKGFELKNKDLEYQLYLLTQTVLLNIPNRIMLLPTNMAYLV
jgi:hypothetical protein